MSTNKKYFYLKLKENFFQTNEMRLLKSLPDGVIFQNIYLQMCLLSLQNDGALTYKNMIPYDINMLAVLLDFEVGTVKLAIETFEKIGLITITDTHTIFMSDIQLLIGQSSTEAERIASYRKRIAGCTKGVQMYAFCTPESESELKLENRVKDRRCDRSHVPEPVEIFDYYLEQQFDVSPVRFYNYNQKKGWVDNNGNPIINWKAAYQTMNESANPDEVFNPKLEFNIGDYDIGETF